MTLETFGLFGLFRYIVLDIGSGNKEKEKKKYV